MNNWAYTNSEFVLEEQASLPVCDLAIQRGYGVFDFFKVTNATPLFLNDHLNRFFFSAAQMRLTVTKSKEELIKLIHLLIKKNNAVDCGIRITLTGGISENGYSIGRPNLILTLHPINFPTKKDFTKGIKLITHPHQRQLPQVKTIDYLMAIWLRPLIEQNQADDVLYCQNEIVSECPRSNFFMVTKEERIVTPANNILQGITRMKTLEIAKQYFKTEERAIRIEEIKKAKEAFITSTTKMILPVRKLNEHTFDEENKITVKLSQLLSQLQNAHTAKMGE